MNSVIENVQAAADAAAEEAIRREAIRRVQAAPWAKAMRRNLDYQLSIIGITPDAYEISDDTLIDLIIGSAAGYGDKRACQPFTVSSGKGSVTLYAIAEQMPRGQESHKVGISLTPQRPTYDSSKLRVSSGALLQLLREAERVANRRANRWWRRS